MQQDLKAEQKWARAFVAGFEARADGDWVATVENEVVELKHVTDWKGYIHSRVMRWYDPQRPIGEVERVKYAMAHERPSPFAELLSRPGMARPCCS